MFYDCYGNAANSEYYRKWKKPAYEIDESDENTKYVRFCSDDIGPIHKIVKNNNIIKLLWAYGSWSNRTTLVFSVPLSESINVNG